MSNRIIVASIWWIMMLAAIVLAGCSAEGRPTTYSLVEREALRVKLDQARDRIWVLDLDGVRVYDAGKRRLARKIQLPKWSVARFTCMPDMALDRTGSAYVSSNAQSKLWRIDAESFEVKVLEIRLEGREHWDMGFGALAFAADGSLAAMTSKGRWLWKIDVGEGRARLAESNVTSMALCDFTAQFWNDQERSGS